MDDARFAPQGAHYHADVTGNRIGPPWSEGMPFQEETVNGGSQPCGPSLFSPPTKVDEQSDELLTHQVRLTPILLQINNHRNAQ